MEKKIFHYISPLKKILFLLADIICITFSMLAAIWVRFGTLEPDLVQKLIVFIPSITPFGLFVFWMLGLYNRTLRFTSLLDAFAIFVAVTGFSAIKVLASFYVTNFAAVKPVLIIDWMQLVMLIDALRIAPRALINVIEISPLRNLLFSKNSSKTKRLMIIGAGQGGESILREIKRNMNLPIEVVGLVDDADEKQGQIIHGVKVVGKTEKLDELCKTYEVDEIIIAIPSASGNELRRIVKLCQNTNIRFKTLPGLQDLIAGKLVSLQLKDIAIEDLLRRAPSEINLAEIAAYITGKTLLVTGAGGSIGSEILAADIIDNQKQRYRFFAGNKFNNIVYDTIARCKQGKQNTVHNNPRKEVRQVDHRLNNAAQNIARTFIQSNSQNNRKRH